MGITYCMGVTHFTRGHYLLQLNVGTCHAQSLIATNVLLLFPLSQTCYLRTYPTTPPPFCAKVVPATDLITQLQPLQLS
jgi:hypothetical protein